MNTEIFKEPINQLHWRVLKTVTLILGLLPVQEVYVQLWKISQESSQIIFGFFAVSLFYSWLSIGFICALQMSHMSLSLARSDVEQRLIQYYKQVPMLFFVLLVAYIGSNYIWEF
ncbi:hypothetical protein [Acinetobacter sp.]|uniref:hypothetical protein n=1 Tax=Acinetobacter sp. TaxID=472 RepID=UPI0031D67394